MDKMKRLSSKTNGNKSIKILMRYKRCNLEYKSVKTIIYKQNQN